MKDQTLLQLALEGKMGRSPPGSGPRSGPAPECSGFPRRKWCRLGSLPSYNEPCPSQQTLSEPAWGSLHTSLMGGYDALPAGGESGSSFIIRRHRCFSIYLKPLHPGDRSWRLARRFQPDWHYLSSRVLPMGFLSSVSIAQHVHRRIARMSLHGISPGVGPHSELRKDKGFTFAPWNYRIYLNNFDALEKMDPVLASRVKGVFAPRCWPSVRDRHPKKSVQQETIAEVQGALVDGMLGESSRSPQRSSAT